MSEGKARHKFEKWIQEAHLYQHEYRLKANVAHDMHDSNQWTSAELDELDDRHQAPSVINIIFAMINAIIGMESQRRTDYRMLPTEERDDDLTTILTEIGSKIFKANHVPFFLSEGMRTGLISGESWFEHFVEKDIDTGRVNVNIALRPWHEFYYDPTSKRPDREDARWISREVWLDLDEAEELYGKELANQLHAFYESPTLHDGFESQEDEARASAGYSFVDRGNRRVAVQNMYYKDPRGKVKFVVFVGDVFLPWEKPDGTLVQTGEDSENPSPWKYNYIPYTSYRAMADKKGKPMGLVEIIKTIQQSINKAQSKEQWLLASKRCIFETGAFADEDIAREEWAKPDGWIEVIEGAIAENKFLQDDNTAEASQTLGWMQFLVLMAQRISGISDTVAGFGGTNARSGTQEAQRIAQSSGMQTPFMQSLYFTKLGLYRKSMLMVGQFYTSKRVVRIKNDDGTLRFLTLNGIDAETEEPFNKMPDILEFDADVTEEPMFTNTNQLYVSAMSEILKSIPGLAGAIMPSIMQSIPGIKDREQVIANIQNALSGGAADG